MNQKIKKIEIGGLPLEVQNEIEEKIKNYVIGLLGVNIGKTGDEVQLLGSGTLVQIGNRFGILTVSHLTRKLKKFRKIGLLLGTFVHKFVIDTALLSIIEIGTYVGGDKGPDLSVIVLPEIHTGTIKAKKSFWNIPYYAEQVLSKPLSEDLSIRLWVVCGVLEEWSKEVEPAKGFDRTVAYCFLCGYTGAEEYWISEEFDYLRLSVLYKDRSDLPISFGGVSGGSIWRVELFCPSEKEITCSHPLLLGVAFYETAIQNDLRSIIGHGWRSIYEQVLSKISLRKGR